MKRIIFVLAFLVLAVTARAEEFGVEIINTGAVVCERGVFPQDVLWVNTTGTPLRVVRSQVWIGADKDTVADIVAGVSRISDWNQINLVAWDHYTNPTGLHQWSQPNNITIAPGDGIRLRYFCNYFSRRLAHTAVAVMVWIQQ